MDRAFLIPAAVVLSIGVPATLLADIGVTYRQWWILLIGSSLWIIARRFLLVTALLPHINPGLLAISAWSVASCLWSLRPAFTLTQAMSMVGIVLVALAFAASAWDRQRFVRVLTIVFTAMLALSLVAGLISPGFAIHSEAAHELNGSWRGITVHKNMLGQAGAIGTILWAYWWINRQRGNLFPALGLALSLLMVVLARSSTALMLSILACGVMLLVLRPPIRIGRFNATPIIVAALIALPLLNFIVLESSTSGGPMAGRVGALFGKDATFSGRSFIWDAMMTEISYHRWTGVGLASFWTTPGSGVERVIAQVQWGAPNAHNGFIDLTNELGLIGLALFSAFLILHGRDIARLARIDRAQFALHLALLVYVFLANITESGWYRGGSTTHLVIVYCSLAVSRTLFDQQLARRYAATAPVVAAPRTDGPRLPAAPLPARAGTAPDAWRRDQ